MDCLEVLGAWLSGVPLPAMAEQFLDEVRSPASRLEQMVDAAADHFEHYLPWILGVLLARVNQLLEDAGGHPLVTTLPVFVRYGVNTGHGLDLMTRGVHSRSLVHALSAAANAAEVEAAGMRDWISAMTIDEWRDGFDASPIDILELLDYTRNRATGVLRAVLEGSVVDIPVHLTRQATDDGPVTIEFGQGPDPVPINIRRDGETIGTVSTPDYTDIAAVVASGLPVDARLHNGQLRLQQPPEDRVTD